MDGRRFARKWLGRIEADVDRLGHQVGHQLLFAWQLQFGGYYLHVVDIPAFVFVERFIYGVKPETDLDRAALVEGLTQIDVPPRPAPIRAVGFEYCSPGCSVRGNLDACAIKTGIFLHVAPFIECEQRIVGAGDVDNS